MTCSTCRWFTPDAALFGYCSFNPPTVHLIGGQPVSLRPKVEADAGCSRWRERLGESIDEYVLKHFARTQKENG